MAIITTTAAANDYGVGTPPIGTLAYSNATIAPIIAVPLDQIAGELVNAQEYYEAYGADPAAIIATMSADAWLTRALALVPEDIRGRYSGPAAAVILALLAVDGERACDALWVIASVVAAHGLPVPSVGELLSTFLLV